MLYYLNRRYGNVHPFICNPGELLKHKTHKKTKNIDERNFSIDDIYVIRKRRILPFIPFKSINIFEKFE